MVKFFTKMIKISPTGSYINFPIYVLKPFFIPFVTQTVDKVTGEYTFIASNSRSQDLSFSSFGIFYGRKASWKNIKFDPFSVGLEIW